jgi:hypothetical protein
MTKIRVTMRGPTGRDIAPTTGRGGLRIDSDFLVTSRVRGLALLHEHIYPTYARGPACHLSSTVMTAFSLSPTISRQSASGPVPVIRAGAILTPRSIHIGDWT